MSFHPNDVGRRSRVAVVLLVGIFALLTSAFFRTQVTGASAWALQSEKNRLREVPLAAPRGIIYDRTGKIIAENLPGYTVSILSLNPDSLRASLERLSTIIVYSPDDIATAIRRFNRAPSRPAVILADASFQEVSVLEEHRTEFPGLIIQSVPKRYYPEAKVVAPFIGYTGEISEKELGLKRFETYKAGQRIGKSGLELEYEEQLKGTEGLRFVEVDARNRVVRDAGAADEVLPKAAPAIRTNIDLDLQRFAVETFGDTLQGAIVALDPNTGAVLALHSGPTYDPNRFTGGIQKSYWDSLNTDPKKPMYNKAIQGTYPPASTYKLATAIMGLERGVVQLTDRMPQPCNGGYWFGNRRFRCWDKNGHGDVTLAQAIEKSCNVYFYQLGLKLGLSNMLAGGVNLRLGERSGIDLPNETRPTWPSSVKYYNDKYGARGWVGGSAAMNLAIGQGNNAQTVVSMARFYTALASGGWSTTPSIVARTVDRKRVFTLSDSQMAGLRDALAGVVSARGTAGSATLQGVIVAGKTGTAQNPGNPDHAWFVGFAPKDDPKIVVAVFVEYGEHGYVAARIATKVIQHYLKTTAIAPPVTE
jgi:penicillin-binding protein 2